ncbi:Bgt-51692 [Blumeria graminis f. sp. tritici]|uniref:Bgt-51692 n=1 Tax=Blumeria graminis f. sp. tritici TaxID=62690 RepID=A0A9X9MED4_BLUGR|nr:Bgt-51692 [Blumeria graminis f. sp. tritici]
MQGKRNFSNYPHTFGKYFLHSPCGGLYIASACSNHISNSGYLIARAHTARALKV